MMGEYCPVEMSFIVGKSTCCKNKNFCTGQPEKDFESNYDLGKGSRLKMIIFKKYFMTLKCAGETQECSQHKIFLTEILIFVFV